jgi:hypothetical protein
MINLYNFKRGDILVVVLISFIKEIIFTFLDHSKIKHPNYKNFSNEGPLNSHHLRNPLRTFPRNNQLLLQNIRVRTSRTRQTL